jgi:AraC family transcriptional regulator
MIRFEHSLKSRIAVPGVTVEIGEYGLSAHHNCGEVLHEHRLILTISDKLPYSVTCLRMGDALSSCIDTGSLHFIPTNSYLEMSSSAGRFRNLTCYFEDAWFEDITELGHNWHSDALSACIDIKKPQLTQILLRLARETETPGFASSKLVEGLGMLAAVELARYLRSITGKPKSASQTFLPWQMRKITDYFENLSSHAPDVAEIAEACGIGSSHFRRLFRQTTDQAIHKYATGVWTAKAKLLLSDTDLSLKEISARLAFSDARNFSISFRRATGLAPNAFRQQFRQRAMR